jgi:hypothetical protein
LTKHINYASFLVRLWRNGEPGQPPQAEDWQGEVEHIQSSERRNFDTLDELLRVLRRQAGASEKDKYNK